MTSTTVPRIPEWWPSVVLVVLAAVAWQVGGALGWWSSQILPPPTEVWSAGAREIATGPFVQDAWSTLTSVVLSMIFGIMAGVLAGFLFWRYNLIGRIVEPYLVSFYTVPLVVFYPMAIVIIGLNQWPIIILSAIMAAIPMTLNTWVGLSGIRTVYLELARSLCLTKRQMMSKVAIPAAAPMMLAGVTMAAIYALIGVVAMEFMVAQEGLGYRIRYRYESFDNEAMYFYIVAILLLSLLVVWLVSLLPRILGIRSVR